VVTLNRPDVHNAFNPDVVDRLYEIFDDLSTQDLVRVILLEARGKSFSAGADLAWMKQEAERAAAATAIEPEEGPTLAHALAKMRDCPQPIIACVQGNAYGGGVGLAAAADIVIAVKAAQFRLSEVRLGLIPSMISPFVIDAIGMRQARRYFMTAEAFDGAAAQAMGLVHILVEDQNGIAAETERLVDEILKNAPGAVAAAKELIEAVGGATVDEDLIEDTTRWIAERRASEEGREGMAAFLQKRKPAWAK